MSPASTPSSRRVISAPGRAFLGLVLLLGKLLVGFLELLDLLAEFGFGVGELLLLRCRRGLAYARSR